MAIHAVLLYISPRFAAGLKLSERPFLTLVGLLMLAGAVYLFAVFRLGRSAAPTGIWWAWICGVGLFMRVLMLPSTPMLETDYYRYLWDGGVLAHGHNPYSHSPQDVLNGDAPPSLLELASAAEPVVERINHRQLKTIYPPIAQAAFAVAHFMAPWRIEGLRIAWLLLDVLTTTLLVLLLKRIGIPASAIVIYWWNPLLIKETYNSAHMELVILPGIVGALLLANSRRSTASACALAVAAAAKLWPVLLLPVIVRQKEVSLGSTVKAVGSFAGLSALLLAPLMLTWNDPDSGFRAYASYWQMNDTLYQIVFRPAQWLVPEQGHLVAKAAIAAFLVAWTAWLCRVPAEDGRSVCDRALWVVAALFLVSPTQFPWYWLWMLPMLAIQPSPGLLFLTATLPLYYLRALLDDLDYELWYDNGLVWIVFLPTFVLLAVEAWQSKNHSSSPALG